MLSFLGDLFNSELIIWIDTSFINLWICLLLTVVFRIVIFQWKTMKFSTVVSVTIPPRTNSLWSSILSHNMKDFPPTHAYIARLSFRLVFKPTSPYPIWTSFGLVSRVTPTTMIKNNLTNTGAKNKLQDCLWNTRLKMKTNITLLSNEQWKDHLI